MPPSPPVSPVAAQPQAASTPQTRADLDALVASRSELRDQLSAATQRRSELLVQQRMAVSGSQADIAARISSLDQRSARLEQQIQAADEAISAGIAKGIATARRAEMSPTVVSVPPMFPRSSSASLAPIIVTNAASVALMAIIVWTVARRRLRGTTAPAIADQSRRLDQLQQAVDTMAVEIERVSEGQRYVTKLLSDRLPATTDRPS